MPVPPLVRAVLTIHGRRICSETKSPTAHYRSSRDYVRIIERRGRGEGLYRGEDGSPNEFYGTVSSLPEFKELRNELRENKREKELRSRRNDVNPCKIDG